ncbi:unnamed protein product [Ilex paraguariensis]|uniref:Uncharacterized protein n=1 Tax=Ilex paraguariensis TaxID=185542 RepID=A0ABC8R9P5_9AQUA
MAECAIDVRHEVGCAIDAGHEVGYACESLLEHEVGYAIDAAIEVRYAVDARHGVGYAIDGGHEVCYAIDTSHGVGYAYESPPKEEQPLLKKQKFDVEETTECAIDVEHEVGYAIDAGHEKFDEEDDNQEPLVEGEGDDSDDWHENKVTEEEWVGTTNNSKKARALTLTNFLITSCVV